jgi:hypothetical protein
MTTRSRTMPCRRIAILALAPFALTLLMSASATPALAKGASIGAVQAACKRTKGCDGTFNKNGTGSGCTPNVCFSCVYGKCVPLRVGSGGRTPTTGTGGSLLRAMTATPNPSIPRGAISTVATSKAMATRESARPAFNHFGGSGGKHR